MENIGFHSTLQSHLLVARILVNRYQVFGVKNVMITGNGDYISFYSSWPYCSLSLFYSVFKAIAYEQASGADVS